MIPWKCLHTAAIPGSDTPLYLYQHGKDFAIRVGTDELMNSRVNGSEIALAELGCARIKKQMECNILIGGLGMGFTVAAALEHIGPKGRITVAELIPEVVEWNRTTLASLAGRPLFNKRVSVQTTDVALLMKDNQDAYEAILLDVDNGPEAMTHEKNSWLYTLQGLQTAYAALRPKGILAVWSAGPSVPFTKRLSKAGFYVKETQVSARGIRGGSKHTIWIATRGR